MSSLSLSRNSSSVSSKPPLLTRVARSGPGTRLEETVRTYIRSQIKVAFDWEIRISDFEIRSLGGFQLGNQNADFIDFLFTVRLGNPKKDSQNCFREQRCSFC